MFTTQLQPAKTMCNDEAVQLDDRAFQTVADSADAWLET